MEPLPSMSLEDYLALDNETDARHEWVNGRAFAMSGGTSRHAAVGANLLGALWSATPGSPCRTASSDQRIHVPGTGAYLYADAALVCGPYVHGAVALDGLADGHTVRLAIADLYDRLDQVDAGRPEHPS